MLSHKAPDRLQLMRLVAQGNSKEGSKGVVVVEIKLWYGHTVRAQGYDTKGPKFFRPDAVTRRDEFSDSDMKTLLPLVDRLIERGESFVTITGAGGGHSCCLEWSISAE